MCGPIQTSTAVGGRCQPAAERVPLWSPNGQELFFVSPTGALLRVGVERGRSWAASTPALLIKGGTYVINVMGGNLGHTYNISRDGQRFLRIKTGGAANTTTPVNRIVVQNFDHELKRLAPAR